ncbi:MAG: nucleoside recognition protein [Lachnospiraceae bacterium]|nr:nucleoside recognition protein [Lachnospiraceae bacterium]
MLNFLWAIMILVGIVYALLTGNISAVTDAALDSAGEGISLCITMAGVMALWMGLMEIGQEAGLVQSMTRGLRPFLNYLFPRIPKGHKALEYIATNMVANILGLGWACTPAGLKAMEELAKLEQERGNPEYLKEAGERSASDEMCTFLIINISSIQLIPVNIIAYRSQYGSVNPAGIVAPAIVATVVSALSGVIYCMVKNWRKL